MPKITDAKSKSKAKRKPLKDVSNGCPKSSIDKYTMKKPDPCAQQQHPPPTRGGGGGRGRCPLDRLLLVHSDLSALIHQIDELVAQALEQKVANKTEIESFADVLYEMQNSLKPWIPRFQKVLSNQSTESENHVEMSFASKKKAPIEDTGKTIDNPEVYDLDFLVSPSPLVSWRADCAAEGGRQLFMLTPLPRTKAFSSRLKGSSKSVFKTITNDITVEPVMENLNDGRRVNPIAGMLSDPVATDTKSAVESGFRSPEKLVKRNVSMVISTPCLKMSPPKSCILLEPIYERSCNNVNSTQNPTPYPGDSESSRSQPSVHLASKYPELFGIRHDHKFGNSRKGVEESPSWHMSPPKTCILLEPTDDKALSKTVVKTNLPKASGIRCDVSSKAVDGTPMCKDLDTTIVRGKHPGENTLKKELWTRFEAATTHGFRLKTSVVQDTVDAGNKNKGFMDLLEEVSCDDKNSIF